MGFDVYYLQWVAEYATLAVNSLPAVPTSVFPDLRFYICTPHLQEIP
jgi:hypothetical protein